MSTTNSNTIAKDAAKPKRNAPKPTRWQNWRVEGRRSDAMDWRTIDQMRTDNAAYFAANDRDGIKAVAINKARMWATNAADLNGAFRGWEFRAIAHD